MSLINFAQGNKENYKAQEMQDTIYLSDNSKEILFNDQSYGNAIPADEEDITAEDGNLKLRDRAYDADNFSGKGYKILRKNIQNGKNILTQDMINEPNTIYEVRYDFDLNGATINIPEGCILNFCGGSFSDGSFSSSSTSFSIFGYGSKVSILNIPDDSLCKMNIPTIYVDPDQGNDANIGSIDSPMRLITEAMKYSNHVSVKRGTIINTFDEWATKKSTYVLDITHSIILDSYGEGPLPILTGKIRFDSGLWTQDEEDIYKLDLTGAVLKLYNKSSQSISIDDSNSFLCNFGIMTDYQLKSNFSRVRTKAQLTNAGDYYSVEYNGNQNHAIGYIKKTTAANMVVASIGVGGIQVQTSASRVNISNLHLSYLGGHGIAGSSHKNLSIHNCLIEYIGGKVQHLGENSMACYGNGIECYLGQEASTDGFLSVRDNIISMCYDCAATMQGQVTTPSEFIGNTITNCPYGVEVFNRTTKQMYCVVSNNIFISCTNDASLWKYYRDGDPNNIRDYYGAIIPWTTIDPSHFLISSNTIINCPLIGLYSRTSEDTPALVGNTITIQVKTPVVKFYAPGHDTSTLQDKYTPQDSLPSTATSILSILEQPSGTNKNSLNKILITGTAEQWALIK